MIGFDVEGISQFISDNLARFLLCFADGKERSCGASSF